ncbi:A-adding tRNA nucleotidyltransferase [subsurface metagenome]|nr:CBS domain-containing protein [Clostridia bacterium]
MAELLAKDIMTRKVITISKDATLAELAKLLIKNKISGVPIVDKREELVGIVTEADLIIKESNLSFPLSFSFAFLESYESYTKSTKEYLETRVEEVMSINVKTAREDMPISKVVNIMINNNINRLPVLNNDGKLTGIITRADIIKSIIKKSKKK